MDAIRAMGVNGVSDFELKLEDTMYEDLKRNEYARLNELKSEGGMMEGYFSDSDYHHMFKFRQTVILADVPIMRSLDEIMDYMRTCAWRGDKDINILMTPEVYASLTDNMDTLFGTHGKYFDMMPNAGIMEYDAELNRHARSLRLRDIRYFPGVDILRAVSNRTTETLTDREQQTLSIALEMASACRRDTPAETARAIHDALCERITYVIDRETLEDDTCIGALLNGQANCDGYADAMLLVGRLAGLNILYQHGDSQQEHISLSTHLWNLIELDGTWRMIDVTWDDNLGDLRYHWFNVGEDRAAQTHKWEREMTMPMLPVTDLNNRPVAEYLVSTTEEITEAARQAQRSGHKVIDLYVTSDLDKETVRDAVWKKLKGTSTTYWHSSLKCLHIVID